MDQDKKAVFEVKKKAYKSPGIKEYGELADITKSFGEDGGETDNVAYYGQQNPS